MEWVDTFFLNTKHFYFAVYSVYCLVYSLPPSPNLSPGSGTVQRYWLNTLPRSVGAEKQSQLPLCRPALSEHKALSPWAPREPGRNHRHLQTSKTQQSLPNKQKPSRVMENASRGRVRWRRSEREHQDEFESEERRQASRERRGLWVRTDTR